MSDGITDAHRENRFKPKPILSSITQKINIPKCCNNCIFITRNPHDNRWKCTNPLQSEWACHKEGDCILHLTCDELAAYFRQRIKAKLTGNPMVECDMRCKFYVESESYSTCKNLDWHHNGTYRCNCEGDVSKCEFWRKKIPQCKYVNSKQNCGAECITMPYTSEMHPTGDLTCPFIDDWGIGKWVCRGYEPRSRFEVHVMGKEPNIIGVFKAREQAEQFIRDNVKVVEMIV